MADEKTEVAEAVVSAPPVEKTEVVAPVSVKKLDPADDLAATFDQFFAGMQAISLRSMKTALARVQEKADAMLTKLDVGGEPPKQP